MSCLEDDQIILSLTRFGLTESERSAVAEHLEGCERCRTKQNKIAPKIKASAEQSARACELAWNNMAAYIRGELNEATQKNIEQHLSECEACRFLYLRNQKQFTLAAMNALNIPVPEELLPKILTAIHEAMPVAESAAIQTEASLSEQISRGVEKAVNHIKMILRPLEFAPAFRGKALFQTSRINHPGGDLLLELGKPDVTVRIFSRDDVELGEQQSDEQGRALFNDFEKAEYKIAVEGFEISEVRTVRT